MDDDGLPKTTAAALREALGTAFQPCGVYVALMRLREAGLLAAGRKGRGGSAPVTPHQAVLALFSVALDRRDAIAAAALAQTVAAYRLRAISPSTGGRPYRQDIPPGPRLDDWLVRQLMGAARDPAASLPALQIEPPSGVYTIDPALLADPPPRLRLVRSNPDLLFEPEPDAPDAPDTPNNRTVLHAVVRRVAIIHPELLCRLAALFAPFPSVAVAIAHRDRDTAA